MFKVNNIDPRISHLFLVFPLVTLNNQMFANSTIKAAHNIPKLFQAKNKDKKATSKS